MKRLWLLLALLLVSCHDGESHPKFDAFASFEWNYVSTNQISCKGQGCGVQFLDRSTNAARWLWNFGDGGTSNLPDNLHFYRDENCGRNATCQFIVNLRVCPEPDLRFDDERCSQAVNIVTVPPPS